MYVLFFLLFVTDPLAMNWGQQYDYRESPDGAIVHCLSCSAHLGIQGVSSHEMQNISCDVVPTKITHKACLLTEPP